MRSIHAALVATALVACHSSSEPDVAPLSEPLVLDFSLAARKLFGTGALRMVAASELDQGHDLDGDGDTQDVVLQLLDLEAGTLVNTGLACPPRFRRDEVPPPEFGCTDALGVFQVSELETGQDLDHDGLPDEVTTWTFDRRTGRLASLPFAHAALMLDGDIGAIFGVDALGVGQLHVFDARDGSLTTLPLVPSSLLGTRDGIVAFTRAEEGAFDLNADGDASDFSVLHLYDADTHLVRNASFDVAFPQFGLHQGFAGFGVREAQHGGLDLNGDGDAEDTVFVAVNGRNGLTRIPGFTSAVFGDAFDPRSRDFLLAVSEEGGDRNGDGDTNDSVALVYDPAADRAVDTGLAVTLPVLFQLDRWVGVSVDEAHQGATDLDRDGLIASHVAHVFDLRTGRSQNLGFSGYFLAALEDQLLGLTLPTATRPGQELFAWDARTRSVSFPGVLAGAVLGSAGNTALVFALESERDLNGDGDLADTVFVLYDGRTHALLDFGLAGVGIDGNLGPQGRGAVLVSEERQGNTDLNGDGDALDHVLHTFELVP